jgi:hypothetical protein
MCSWETRAEDVAAFLADSRVAAKNKSPRRKPRA